MKTLIKNGTLVDPSQDIHGKFDVLICDGKVLEVNECIEEKDDYEIIDAAGFHVVPGFVDLHVHFREPGLTHKETVKTGSLAAARGGYTSVFCMPNTKPVIDSVANYELLMDIIEKDACINVFPVGAITVGQSGETLAEISEMASKGMKAISEDGKSVLNSRIYREAMYIAKEADIPVFAHCEDIDLVDGGVMNMGKRADELGLRGISNAVEDIITARDILLAKETGARLHLCHVSTKDSVEMVRQAKEQGLPVSAEACPHHFILSDEDIPCDDSNYKMNPPLRSKADVAALKSGLENGILEVISTDHAPHSAEEKNRSMKESPFGIVGSETAFSLSYTELVEKGKMSIVELVKCMSTNPAKIAGIDRGSLSIGKMADIAIVDLDSCYTIDKNTFASMGKNTPFDGWKVKGLVKRTIVAGKTVFMEDEK